MKITIYENPRREFLTSWESETVPVEGDEILIAGLVVGSVDTKVGFSVRKRLWITTLGGRPSVQVYVDRWGKALNEINIA